MSIKKKRIDMLIRLSNNLDRIQNDKREQTPESVVSNMKAMKEHVAHILKLDGISCISANSVCKSGDKK